MYTHKQLGGRGLGHVTWQDGCTHTLWFARAKSALTSRSSCQGSAWCYWRGVQVDQEADMDGKEEMEQTQIEATITKETYILLENSNVYYFISTL